MKKIFSLFAAVLFAGSMMAESPKVTLDFTTDGPQSPNPWGFPVANQTAEKSYTKDGYTITINAATGHKAQFTNSGTDTTWVSVLFGKNGATLTLPTFSFAVSKIVVYGRSGASGKVTTNIYVGETAVSTEVTGSTGTNTFEINSSYQAAGNKYVLKVTNANNAQASKIEIYEKVAGAPENPTFSVPAGVYDAAQSVELDCETDGADIFYTLDGTDPTSGSAQYSTAIPVNVTTTIKAIAIKNSVPSAVVSARYKIVSLEGDGTADNPYTVSDVLELENSRPAKAWVKGYILGGAKSSSGLVIDNDVTTAIALADVAGETDMTKAISVQLGTDVRGVLAAASNRGALVKVNGTLESYLTVPGVKGINAEADYVIINTPTALDNTAVEGKATKELREGQVLIIKGNKTYNILGQEIK